MRLNPRRNRPENIGGIENIDIVIEHEDILGVIESQRGGGGARRIPFGQFFHRDENIVMRVAALLADRCDAWYRLAAAAQIGAFARQIHPRLVALRRNYRLVHGAVAVVDRLNLVFDASRVTLRTEITRRFTEGAFNHTTARLEHAFDDDFSVRGNEQIVAKRFRSNQAQRFAQVAADHIVLADFERSAVASAHVVGRMMTEHGRHGHLLIVFFVVFENLPQVAWRGIKGGGGLRFHFHPVVRTIVDTAFSIFGDRRQNDVRPAVHFMMAHDRNLIQIHVLPDHGVFLYWRVLFADDRRRNAVLFHLQAFVGHLWTRRVTRHAQSDLGFSLRYFAVHGQLDRTDLAVQI